MVDCEHLLQCGRSKERRTNNRDACKPHVKRNNGTNSRNGCNGNEHPSSDEEANASFEKLSRDFPDSVARSSSSASKCKEMSEDKESVHEQHDMEQASSSSVVSTDSDESSPESTFSIGEIQIPDGDKKPAHEPALKKAPKAPKTPKHEQGKGRSRKMTTEERAYQAATSASVDPAVQDQFACASDTE